MPQVALLAAFVGGDDVPPANAIAADGALDGAARTLEPRYTALDTGVFELPTPFDWAARGSFDRRRPDDDGEAPPPFVAYDVCEDQVRQSRVHK